MSVTLSLVMIVMSGMLVVMVGTEQGPFLEIITPTTWRTDVVVCAVCPALAYTEDAN